MEPDRCSPPVGLLKLESDGAGRDAAVGALIPEDLGSAVELCNRVVLPRVEVRGLTGSRLGDPTLSSSGSGATRRRAPLPPTEGTADVPPASLPPILAAGLRSERVREGIDDIVVMEIVVYRHC